MSGMNIHTNQAHDDALRAARDAATDLGFTVSETSADELRATKGNLALSIFIGAFVAYCNFQITCSSGQGGTTIFIQRNKPWWTGLIGIGRVTKQAKLLAERIKAYIEDMGQSARVEEVK